MTKILGVGGEKKAGGCPDGFVHTQINFYNRTVFLLLVGFNSVS